MYTHRNKKINPKFPLDIFTGNLEPHKQSKDGNEKEDTEFKLIFETMDKKSEPIDTFIFSKGEIEEEHGKLTIRSCVELILDNPSIPLFEFEVYEVGVSQDPYIPSTDDIKKQTLINQLQQKKDEQPNSATYYFISKDKALTFSEELIRKADERLRYNLSITKVPLYGVNSSVFKTDE